MTKAPIAADARRLASAVDRLDAVSAAHREAAARHVYDVCVYHVTRVRKTHPAPISHRGRGRLPSIAMEPTPTLVFDIVQPHIYRIARRLDRAMRHAETSPHPADVAALIVAVDAQGALAALFAVAQNAGVNPLQLEALAVPLRKRSAPALLRTLFSPDMRVANAAKKALRQVAAIASCQGSPWMTSIRAALELRTASRAHRSNLLRNLLSKLAEILHLVVRQAAASKVLLQTELTRKRSSRSSLGTLMSKPRPSLSMERKKAADKSALSSERSVFRTLFGGSGLRGVLRSSKFYDEWEHERSSRRRTRTDGHLRRSVGRSNIPDDAQSATSHGGMSTTGSFLGSVFSNSTEVGNAPRQSPSSPSNKRNVATVKRDAATAMYIFERLLAKRTNPDLEDRIEVISTLADIAQVTFSGHYASSHKLECAEEYSETMAAVFNLHGKKIYSIVLDILFRPVRAADANRIGVFSFHETGIVDFDIDSPYILRKVLEFPQSAVCLPNMDCTGLAAVSCNSLLKVLLRFVPGVCAQRMALLTGTINNAFLHSSEALQRTEDGCSWEVSKVVSAVDALTVLVALIPKTVDDALNLIVRESVTLRLVIETCVRSVSATGRLLAQNAARASAPRLTDEGTLDSLRSWQALIRILPGTSTWAGTPSYSSSVLFLAQVARRAALIAVLQGYRKERYANRVGDENVSDEAYPSVSTLNSAGSGAAASVEDSNSGPSSFGGNGAGFEMEDNNVLTAELHQCIMAMINVAGTNAADVFFDLYRTVVYLYATDLQKNHNQVVGKASIPATTIQGSTSTEDRDRNVGGIGKGVKNVGVPLVKQRTQSEEDAKGVLVENIAVDGQLPSRALRRAVMASELDLGEYFNANGGQPLSLQQMSPHQTGVPPGMHTFEEFSHAMAIIIGTLYNKTITENYEDPHEAAQLIARDVQRSSSSYLKRVHKRARSILRKTAMNQDYDWRSVRYEERIRKLEEEVSQLRGLVKTTIEQNMYISQRRPLHRIAGLFGDGNGNLEHTKPFDVSCHSNCFCPT